MLPRDLIYAHYEKCTTCKYRTKNASPILPDSDLMWRRGATAQMDLTEPAIRGDGGFRYICTIVDCSTGYVQCEAIANKASAVTVAAHFLDNNPHVTSLRVDNAGELTGKSMQATTQRQGVALEEVAPGASGSNGAVERAHGTVKRKIDEMMKDLGFSERTELWPWFVKGAQAAINFTHSKSKNGIPALLRSDILTKSHGKRFHDLPFPPFAFKDTVKFRTPRDSRGREMTVTGHRQGVFLGYIHSGACEVLSVQDERVVRWIVHPSWVQAEDPDLLPDLMHHLRWALGSESSRFRTTNLEHLEPEPPPNHVHNLYDYIFTDRRLSTLPPHCSERPRASGPDFGDAAQLDEL